MNNYNHLFDEQVLSPKNKQGNIVDNRTRLKKTHQSCS